MPFDVPQRAPAVSRLQRENEDSHWRAKYANGGSDGHVKGHSIGAKLNGLFTGQQGDLPMYKDKPHYPSSHRKQTMSPRTAGLLFIIISVISLNFVLFGGFGGSGRSPHISATKSLWSSGKDADWAFRRETVKQAFVTSWDGYEKYAWGMDEYHPVSKQGKNLYKTGPGIGWIIIDALDTAMLMNLTSQVEHARQWLKTSLSWATADVEVNTFETTIRLLGGLLSAHYLSTTFPHLAPQFDDDTRQPGEDLYLELATDLADRLLGAFDTKSGIPLPSVNLNTSIGVIFNADSGASSTAEAATLQLELKYLSKLTGEPVYWEHAERVIQVLEANQRQDGLVPIFIHAVTGQFRGQLIRLGSRGDSYYEYLIKQYLQTGGAEDVYLSMWEEALEGIKKHLLAYSKHADLLILGERQSGLVSTLTPKMDHLICFLPGTIALSATGGQTVQEAKARLGKAWTSKHDENIRIAEELARTCWATYKATKTGLAPEIAYFALDEKPRMWADHHSVNEMTDSELSLDDSEDADWRMDVNIHDLDLHNLQRPETVESLYYLWKITGKVIYREWGWEMFESFMQYSKVADDTTGEIYGYTSLGNVNKIPAGISRKDNMEGFWLAETLKYFWLLFGGNELESQGALALDQMVINTEAHILPRFELGRVWKTGWNRTNPLFRDPSSDNTPKSQQQDPEREIHGTKDDRYSPSQDQEQHHPAAQEQMEQTVDTRGILGGDQDQSRNGAATTIVEHGSSVDGDHEHGTGPVEDYKDDHVVEMKPDR